MLDVISMGELRCLKFTYFLLIESKKNVSEKED